MADLTYSGQLLGKRASSEVVYDVTFPSDKLCQHPIQRDTLRYNRYGPHDFLLESLLLAFGFFPLAVACLCFLIGKVVARRYG